MSTRATAVAPSNIAFIKYWGAKDLGRALPVNPSLSMTLSTCRTITTVEVDPRSAAADRIHLVQESGEILDVPEAFHRRFAAHVEALRHRLSIRGRVEAWTRNTFPSDAGIASSAAGFAALAVAVSAAFDAPADPAELSLRARLSGSGSATRSVLGGFVTWPPEDVPEGPAQCLAGPDHWDLRDVIALVQEGKKDVSSLDGHRRAPTSPHFETRLRRLPDRFHAAVRTVRERDFDALATLLEAEALELHLIAMSSVPPILYWTGGTVDVLHRVRQLRSSGTPCAFTMDAGANVHVICPAPSEDEVVRALEELPSVREVLRDRVGPGAHTVDTAVI